MSEMNRNDQVVMPPKVIQQKPQLPPNELCESNPRGEGLGTQLRKNRPPRMYRSSTLMTSPNPNIRNVRSS